MFKTTLLSLLLMLFFSACSPKQPNTWQERVLNTKQKALPLAYSEYGDKRNKTLLLVHGFGESRQTWHSIVPELSKHYHLVLVDLKGFGDSPKTEDDAYSVYDQAKVLSAFIKEKELKDLTIVAHSLGGGVSLVMALMQNDGLLEANRLTSLILINSIAYRQALPSMLKTLNRPIIGFLAIHLISNDWIANEGYRFAFYNDDLIPKESVAHTSRCLGLPLAKYAYLQSVGQLVPDDIETMEARYKEIGLPTLILWGRKDVSLQLYQAQRLHDSLKNSRLKIFENVGHMPQEESPKRVIGEILKFMEEKP